MKMILALLASALAVQAQATPSTQIWIPSTDIQPYKVWHLNIDTYLRTQDENNGVRKGPMEMVGPTVGILPTQKIQAEAGFDLMYQGDKVLDNNPLYFHGKVGTPEKSLAEWSPAFAVGCYNIGTKNGYTNQDLTYGLMARTFPVVGRISAGYYGGNGAVLRDSQGRMANNGLLASWDRTMKEISDKLWFAVDYQGGESLVGSTNLGFSWAFSEKTSVLFGYDIYSDRAVAGKNTVTIQVDINL